MIQQIAVIYSNRCFAPSKNTVEAVEKKHPGVIVWFRKEAEVNNEMFSTHVLRQEEQTINAGPYIVWYRLVEVQTG